MTDGILPREGHYVKTTCTEFNEKCLKVERGVNGFVLTVMVDEEDGYLIEKVVFEEEDGNDYKKSFLSLVNFIHDWAGISYDKYGKENLRVSFDKPGHKICDNDNKDK